MTSRVQQGYAHISKMLVLACFGFAIVILGAEAHAAPPREHHVWDMYKHTWFWEVLAASIAGWVLGLVKGFSGTRDWLTKYWKQPPIPLTFALDLLVFVFIGAFIGTGVYNPNSFVEALAAGLTWPVGLGALATK